MRRDDMIVPTAEEHARWRTADAQRREYIATELRALYGALPVAERRRLVFLAKKMAVGDIASVDVVRAWVAELDAADPSWKVET